MEDQIFNSKDLPWVEEKVGSTKIIVGKEISKNASFRLYSLGPNQEFRTHEHNYTQVMYFPEGSGEVSVDENIHNIEPGLIVVVLPNQCHSVKNTSTNEMTIFVFESYENNRTDTPFIDF